MLFFPNMCVSFKIISHYLPAVSLLKIDGCFFYQNSQNSKSKWRKKKTIFYNPKSCSPIPGSNDFECCSSFMANAVLCAFYFIFVTSYAISVRALHHMLGFTVHVKSANVSFHRHNAVLATHERNLS